MNHNTKRQLHPVGVTQEINQSMLQKTKAAHIRTERNMRDNLSEKQVDKMLKDSFPASDPPSTY